MTIIAYRNGVLAADSCIYEGGTILYGRTKTFRRDDGTLYAGIGNCSVVNAFVDWVAAGEVGVQPKIDKESGGLIVRPDRKELYFDEDGHHDLQAEYFAAGSGMDFALGAMAVGASAIEAVRAAIMHCTTCAGDVHFVEHWPTGTIDTMAVHANKGWKDAA